MKTYWLASVVFIVTAVFVAAGYWALSDEDRWWAYVVFDNGERVGKFRFGWPEQMVVSGVVGAMVAVPVTAVVVVSRWLARRS